MNENSRAGTKKVIIGVSIVVLLILLAITGRWFLRNRTVARVGSHEIHAYDVTLRDQMIALDYPGVKESYGLKQLVQAYTYAEILKNNGAELTPAMVLEEERRISANSKNPEGLNRIRAIFGDDIEAFRRVFVLPVLAERTIYFDFFQKSPIAQAKSLKRAQDYISRAKAKPKDFASLAKEAGADVREFRLSESNGFEWIEQDPKHSAKSKTGEPPTPKAAPPAEVQAVLANKDAAESRSALKEWQERILKSIKTGDVIEQAVSSESAWLVVRYLGAIKDQHAFECFAVKKDDYGQWLASETSKVKRTAPPSAL